MKPEIYYDKNETDLVWLPKHTELIAEVATELSAKGIHYDSTILGKCTPRKEGYRGTIYNPYVAWTCRNAEKLLTHPKIQEVLQMDTPRQIPSKEQVLHAAKECPQTKQALEILFPDDFKPEPLKPISNITEHYAIINGALLVSPEVQKRLDCGVWDARYGSRGPKHILSDPYFDGWEGIYISGFYLIDLLHQIQALGKKG